MSLCDDAADATPLLLRRAISGASPAERGGRYGNALGELLSNGVRSGGESCCIWCGNRCIGGKGWGVYGNDWRWFGWT